MKLYYLLPLLFLSLTGIAQDHFFPDGIYEAERRPDSEATLIRYMDLFNKTLTLCPNVITR